ncbi:carbohydrate-binding protein [Aquimarina sp. MAR_2010_214]|uniref:carbohydrate-binding protein n=1 Tax=Aquimarina sp. MAR_2010_214 TaxID=1250026 RepID=UPI0013046AAC|nr:carbohydrate-binding protein [Aquimarina sp. MAR_2010_214]
MSSITVTSSGGTIDLGQTQQFSAQGYDQFGNAYDATYTWDTTGGSISSTGLFTGSLEGTHTITATHGSISGNADITVVGNNNPTGINLPGIVQVEDYNEGGEGVGYHDLDTGNTGGAYKNDDVDIEVTGDASGGYNIGWIGAGEWLEYTVNSTTTSGKFDIDFRVASPSGNGSFHLELDGVSITDQTSVPVTGGWQNYQTVTITNVPVSNGLHQLRVVFDASGLNLNFVEFREVTTGDNTDTCSGTATNGQYSYAISSDIKNPTITFIPEITGMGNGVCILYYGVSATGPYPGHSVTPNVAHQINASNGEKVHFYYTYSLPTGGENNTAGNPHNFIVGSCNNIKSFDFQNNRNKSSEVFVYPNPIIDKAHIQLPSRQHYHAYKVLDVSGRVILNQSISKDTLVIDIDLSQQETGLYFLKLYSNSNNHSLKLLKK